MNISSQNNVTLNAVPLIPTKVGIYVFLLLSSFILHPSVLCFADTTFVSGAVSGEWTREGNPYIVFDSTWVPEGERLTLTAGVEAFFNEGQGLYVFGGLDALSDIENFRDQIKVSVLEGVQHWQGIRLYGRGVTNWVYAEIDCPDTAFFLDNGYRFNMNYCEIQSFRSFCGYDNQGVLHNCSFDIQNSQITGGRWITYAGGLVRKVLYIELQRRRIRSRHLWHGRRRYCIQLIRMSGIRYMRRNYFHNR